MLKSGGSIQVSVTLEVVATVEIIFGAGLHHKNNENSATIHFIILTNDIQ